MSSCDARCQDIERRPGAPMYLQFQEAYEDDDLISYCQVDGEFFKLVNPCDVVIKPILQLRVLHNDGMDDASASESSSEEDKGESRHGGFGHWSVSKTTTQLIHINILPNPCPNYPSIIATLD